MDLSQTDEEAELEFREGELNRHENELKRLDERWGDDIAMAQRYRDHGGDIQFWMPLTPHEGPIQEQIERRTEIIKSLGEKPPKITKALLAKEVGQGDSDEEIPHEPLRQLVRHAHVLKTPATDALAKAREKHKKDKDALKG